MCSTNCPDTRPRFDVKADEALTDAEWHERLYYERETYNPAGCLRAVATGYRIGLGLPEPDLSDDRCDLKRAEDVARWHAGLDPVPQSDLDYYRTKTAYRDLVAQVDRQLMLAVGIGIHVDFVDEKEPYATAEEQALDVIRNRRIKIATIQVWPDYWHPMFSNEVGGGYDRFRAVHDLFGHVATGTGFDRHGEWTSYLTHLSMFTGDAARAAATELHGENSYLAVYGKAARHKAALMPEVWCDR